MASKLKHKNKIEVKYIENPADPAMSISDISTDYYRISFIVTGNVLIAASDRTMVAQNGNVSLFNIGQKYQITPASVIPYNRYVVEFSPTVIQPMMTQIGKDTFENLISGVCYEITTICQKKVKNLFEEMLWEYEHYDDNSEFIITGMIENLILLVLKNGTTVETGFSSVMSSDDPITQKILTYIQLNYSKNPSIEKAAEYAGIHKTYLSTRFKNATGFTFMTFVKNYRFNIAKHMLISTDKSLDEISKELGFCSTISFCNHFRQMADCTPREYRKKHL